VLLAEDNRMVSTMAVRLLNRAFPFCSVEVAADGQEAFDAWSRRRVEADARFDLILMDLQMPRCDGFASAGLIRAAEFGDEHVPIVAVSANVQSPELSERLSACGFDGLLPKPVAENELQAAVGKYFQHAVGPG
jgi:two-component system, sensor histidine kinase and response regulator